MTARSERTSLASNAIKRALVRMNPGSWRLASVLAGRTLAAAPRLENPRLQFVTEGIVVTALQATFRPLAFAGDDQVLETTGAMGRGFATFGAFFVALPAHLVFALARNRQVRELVDNKSIHNQSKSSLPKGDRGTG